MSLADLRNRLHFLGPSSTRPEKRVRVTGSASTDRRQEGRISGSSSLGQVGRSFRNAAMPALGLRRAEARGHALAFLALPPAGKSCRLLEDLWLGHRSH